MQPNGAQTFGPLSFGSNQAARRASTGQLLINALLVLVLPALVIGVFLTLVPIGPITVVGLAGAIFVLALGILFGRISQHRLVGSLPITVSSNGLVVFETAWRYLRKIPRHISEAQIGEIFILRFPENGAPIGVMIRLRSREEVSLGIREPVEEAALVLALETVWPNLCRSVSESGLSTLHYDPDHRI